MHTAYYNEYSYHLDRMMEFKAVSYTHLYRIADADCRVVRGVLYLLPAVVFS